MVPTVIELGQPVDHMPPSEASEVVLNAAQGAVALVVAWARFGHDF